jgi:hypothetical protein
MKFIIATYGAEGDARPFAALCRGLMDAGHEARLPRCETAPERSATRCPRRAALWMPWQPLSASRQVKAPCILRLAQVHDSS